VFISWALVKVGSSYMIFGGHVVASTRVIGRWGMVEMELTEPAIGERAELKRRWDRWRFLLSETDDMVEVLVYTCVDMLLDDGIPLVVGTS
jgi:hypothetical protein